jgi:hypothetical protein
MRTATHATIDNIQLLSNEGLSTSPFHWGGPHDFKGGNVFEFDNYKGIMVGAYPSKVVRYDF